MSVPDFIEKYGGLDDGMHVSDVEVSLAGVLEGYFKCIVYKHLGPRNYRVPTPLSWPKLFCATVLCIRAVCGAYKCREVDARSCERWQTEIL